MTSITDMVQEHLRDNGVAQLSRHLGVDPATAEAAMAAALPALVSAASSKLSEPGVPACRRRAVWPARPEPEGQQSGLGGVLDAVERILHSGSRGQGGN